MHQGCQVPFRISRRNVGFLLRRCSGKWPHLTMTGSLVVFLELRRDPRVTTGNSETYSISDLNRRVPAVLKQDSQASSCVGEWNSACLLSCSQVDRPLVKFYLEPAGFSGQCNWGVSAPSRCDFIHRVTFEEVSGHRVLVQSRWGNESLSECGRTLGATTRISL